MCDNIFLIPFSLERLCFCQVFIQRGGVALLDKAEQVRLYGVRVGSVSATIF